MGCRLAGLMSLVVAALILLDPPSAGAQALLPTTPCDAVVSHVILGSPLRLEDGTLNFRYGPDNRSFVNVSGSTLSINVTLLFAPDDEQDSIRFVTYDASCQPLYGQAYGHGAGWLNSKAENRLAFNFGTFKLSINGNLASEVNVLKGSQARYIAIEVFDFGGYPKINQATYSYLIDLQNPQNPGATVNTAAFVSETVPDNTALLPGKVYTKTWMLRNTGTATWTLAYTLRYVSGNTGCPHTNVAVSGTVAPNATYTFAINCAAPMSVATFREDWRLVAPDGGTINVGSSPTIWVQIKTGTGALIKFGPIASPQSAGVPFPLTLTAVDANDVVVSTFQGEVQLSSTRGPLTPTRVTFASGRAIASVTVGQPASQVELLAWTSDVSISARSLPFEVVGTTGPVTVIVTVLDERGQPAPGATVTAKAGHSRSPP